MKRFTAFVALIVGLAVAFSVVAGVPSTKAQDTEEDERITMLEERVAALEGAIGESPATASQQTEPSESGSPSTGQSPSILTLDALEFEVVGIGPLDEESLSVIQENYPTTGIYQKVELNVTNTGNVPYSGFDIPWDEFQLIDDQGRTFSYASGPSSFLFGYNSMLYEDLQPGLPENGYIVYELPPDASGFEMALKSSDQRVPVESLVE